MSKKEDTKRDLIPIHGGHLDPNRDYRFIPLQPPPNPEKKEEPTQCN